MKLLTVKMVAEQAGVSPGLIYELCARGVLPHVRLGRPGRRGTIRIDPDELAAFLAGMRGGGVRSAVPPPAPSPPVRLKNLSLD
jgi:excisionase family DNA binding protein